MTNPDWWQTLVETALLGTERRTVDVASLPPDLRSSADHVTPEQTLLETAALTGNFLRAGQEPLTTAFPTLPTCSPETRPYAPEPAMRIFDQLLDDKPPNRRLLRLWVQKIRARGWIISTDRLVNLFSKHANMDVEADPDELYFVIGERGHWLGEFNEKWRYERPKSLEEDWDETPDLRDLTFYQLRGTKPDEARKLVEENWSQMGLTNRKLLLSGFARNLSVADEPFLNTLRAELALMKKPKQTHIEQYETVTQLLLRLPGNELFLEIVDALRPYIGEQKGMLNRLMGKARKDIRLPTKQDGFFNSEQMKRLGIDTTESLDEPVQIMAWLMGLVMVLHPRAWTILLNDENLRPVPFFMQQPWLKGEEDGMVHALQTMISTFERADWVPDLLPHKSLVTAWPKLLGLLPSHQYQDLLMNHLDLINTYGNYQFMTDENAPAWSLPFSEYIWGVILKSWATQPNVKGAERQFLRDAAAVIHPGVLANADAKLTTLLTNYQHANARQHLLDPMVRWLSIRRAIEQL